MIVLRWHCHARFGKKEELVGKVKQWWSTIGKEIGQTDYTIVTGGVGSPEALVSVDVRVRDLAELNEHWNSLDQRKDHQAFGKEMEPLVVSGSNKWEILRVVE